ncbi:MAG: hypothetical protein NTU98_10310 [Bacteroidetes bacterium]|nr:hypothetical protein [Bacteroidota bacterium]
MTLFQNKYRIETTRLKGWDYSKPGAYFITIVTKNREWLFGNIVVNEMMLNDAGNIAQQSYLDIPNHFPNVKLDAFIIMPNHVHGIIFITENHVDAQNFAPLSITIPVPAMAETQNFASLPYKNQFGPQSKNLASIVRGFKIGVTKWFRENNNQNSIWQPRFHDHIIRNDESLQRIRDYIENNPKAWNKGTFFR